MYKMIVVDDEYFTCEGLKILLNWKELNIEIVGSAMNGEDGLKLVEQENPDIVITDIRMKIMDGLTMIQKLRSNGYQGEVIVLSGYKVFEYAQEAMASNVSSYLLKPITKDKMIDAIKIVLKKLDDKKGRASGDMPDADDKWSVLMKYIDDNITKITLKEAATLACLETSYFSRTFKKRTGMGFLEYITQKRMMTAKKLLTETDMNVEEIMYYLSYNDSKYFRTLFKKSTGYSPKEYRNIYKVKE